MSADALAWLCMGCILVVGFIMAMLTRSDDSCSRDYPPQDPESDD